jgi:hypothetical protein
VRRRGSHEDDEGEDQHVNADRGDRAPSELSAFLFVAFDELLSQVHNASYFA